MRFTNAALALGNSPQSVGVFTPSSAPPAPAKATFTIPQNTASLVVQVGSLGASIPYCAQAFNLSTNSLGMGIAIAPFGPVPGGFQAILPFPADAGEQGELWVYTSAAAIVTMNVTSLSGCPVKVRPDGRAYPLGSLGSPLYNSTGSGNVIAVPASPLRLLLKSAWLMGAEAELNAIVGGVGSTLIMSQGGSPAVSPIIGESGLLLDIGSNLGILNIGAAQVLAGAVYDIVV